MADEPVTEQEPVVEDNVEPVEPEQAQEETQEPQYMTSDQVMEAISKVTNDTKTWLGRRDKDLLNHVGNIIEERISKKVETPEELSSKLLEDPVSTVGQIMSDLEMQRTTKSQQHASETFTHLGNMMDSDPLYEDKDLGDQLVEEVKKQFQSGKINTNLDPEAAAKVLHAEALANVMRNRKKGNALSSNAPAKGAGTLQPGVPNTNKKLKVPELDPETLALAKKWGYSDEALAKLYGRKG